MALCDVADGVHLASNPRVVNHDDGLGARRDGRFDAVLIDIQRVRANIDEHWNAAP